MAQPNVHPVDRPAYHHGDLAAALTQTALERLRVGGAEAVSLRKLAAEHGVSPSAAYSHFADKDQLLRAVADRATEYFDAALEQAANAVVGETDADSVRRFLTVGAAYVHFALAEPHLFEHIFGPYCAYAASAESAGDLFAPQLIEESLAFQLLVRGLADLTDRGLLQPDLGAGFPVVLWTTVHGFASLVTRGCVPTAWQGDFLRAVGMVFLNDRGLALAAQAELD